MHLTLGSSWCLGVTGIWTCWIKIHYLFRCQCIHNTTHLGWAVNTLSCLKNKNNTKGKKTLTQNLKISVKFGFVLVSWDVMRILIINIPLMGYWVILVLPMVSSVYNINTYIIIYARKTQKNQCMMVCIQLQILPRRQCCKYLCILELFTQLEVLSK